LLVLVAINILGNTTICLSDPFYPDVAESKGTDKVELGYIYAIYSLGAIGSSIQGCSN